MREALADARRQAAASPSAEDFAKEAGAAVEYKGDGSWTATVRDPDKIRRAVRMMDGARKFEVERGAKLDASVTKEVLVGEDGRSTRVPVETAEFIAKKRGLRPAGRRGGSRITMTGGWLPNARDRERMARGEG